MESAFGALNSIFSVKTAVKFLTKGKERFGLETSSISKGNKLNATLFNPEGYDMFSKNDMYSKSKNSIFEGHSVKGKVYGIINNNQIQL
jgi:dihydroorotase